MVNTTKIIKEILDLHKEYFIPLQYNYNKKKMEYMEVTPCIRTVFCEQTDSCDKGVITADVIVYTRKGHDFMDGSWYYNADGIGYGRTVEASLKDLLRKTKKSVKMIQDEDF